jgi:dihydrolipoyl dehydrogenase
VLATRANPNGRISLALCPKVQSVTPVAEARIDDYICAAFSASARAKGAANAESLQMADAYDLIVIGTGPGGYVCAIRAAQLGLKVAVVEKRATHGGTCLNVGCIPSKALLHASEAYEEAGHGFAAMGIEVAPTLDLARMLAFKDEGVKGNVDGVAYLLKKNKIDTFHGTGTILAPGRVGVTPGGGDRQELETKSIVIATGSDVARLPGIDIDEQTIVSSTGALTLPKVPKRLLVVGAGVIGLELGSVWRRLGSEVMVVEFLDHILPGTDAEVARTLQRILSKQGMSFKLGSKVTAIAHNAFGHKVAIEPAKGDGEGMMVDADVVLVAIGRVPYTGGLGLEAVGVKLDNRKRIVVDQHYQTDVPGIYAIGDVIAGPMLAHKAEDEGMAVAELLGGQAGHVNYDAIPNVIYTSPEVATVGKSEEDLKVAGIAYKVGKFPFTANGRAKVNKTTDGFVKILADAATDRVLGVHIIAAQASEMIAEAAVIMEFGGSAEDLARTCHAHPTLTEAVKEAALAVDKRAIHM